MNQLNTLNNNEKGVISRTKHLDLRKFYIKEDIDEGRSKLEYVSTEENLADVCTKPVKRNILERLCEMLYCLWRGSGN